MYRGKITCYLILLVLLGACRKKDYDPNFLAYSYNFETGTQGWQSLFSDYPVGEEAGYQLAFEHTTLPSPLESNGKALKMHGNNHSDDLLMMLYKKIEGLKPKTSYAVTFNVQLASNAIKNGFGAGGSPDLSLGGGVISHEPENKTELVGNTYYYRPNFQVRLQSNLSNEICKVLGKIGANESSPEFKMINRNNLSDPLMITTNQNGEAWIIVGVDSGFEGITTLYYKSIAVRFVQK